MSDYIEIVSVPMVFSIFEDENGRLKTRVECGPTTFHVELDESAQDYMYDIIRDFTINGDNNFG